MANERFSKLQKWILVSAYKIIILCDRTNFTLKICKNYDNDLCKANHIKGRYNDICKRRCYTDKFCCAFRLYKEDILIDYYKLKFSDKRYPCYKLAFFYDNAETNKAHIAIARSLALLEQREYIELFCSGQSRYIVLLTEKGISKAKELIN